MKKATIHILIPLWMCVAGCQQPDARPGTDPTAPHTGVATTPETSLWERRTSALIPVSATAQLNPNNPFSALVSVIAPRPIEARVRYGADSATPWQAIGTGQTAEIVVLGLHAATTYELELEVDDGHTTTISPLPPLTTDPPLDHWTECQVTATHATIDMDGDEVFCVNSFRGVNDHAMTCFDRRGRPRWSLRHPDDTDLFMMQALSDGTFAAVSGAVSQLSLYDRAGRMTAAYSHLWFQDKTRFRHDWISSHEVLEIKEGPWQGALALLTITQDAMPDDSAIAASGILIFDHRTEQVLWDWSLHGELGDGETIDASFPYAQNCERTGGCLVANALLIGVDDDHGPYAWLNFKELNWIVKIDTETDEVSWRLGLDGDFELVENLGIGPPEPLADRAWMFFHHAPEWQERGGGRTRFLVFDNGANVPEEIEQATPFSRVVEFEIDEDLYQATTRFDYGNEGPEHEAHFYGEYCGDVDMMPGEESLVFLVGYNELRITELSYPEGDIRWQLYCPYRDVVYRFNYYPDLYHAVD